MSAEHHIAVEESGETRGHQAAGPGVEKAALQHGEDVEEGEHGARAAARRDNGGDESDVEADLHPREPAELGAAGGAAEEHARHEHEAGRDEPRPAEPAQGRPQELPVFHCCRYLTRVTSLKIGRYMATTRPPMITPRTTIMMGSRSAVSAPTAVSTSSS